MDTERLWACVWAWAAVLALTCTRADGWGDIKGEPRVTNQWPSSQVIREGETVKLTCPITANPDPLYDWIKDGESIKATWNRYIHKNRLLKIKSTRSGDGGVYTCVGVNGFGAANSSITLVVLGKGEAMANLTRPVLTQIWPQEAQHRRPGESLTFTCRAKGVPRPLITWYKNDVLLDQRGEQIALRSVTPSDTGKYTCRATSDYGVTTGNFSLFVGEGVEQQLHISDAVNTTVVEGASTSLQCSVRTSQQPRVEWLKEFSSDDTREEGALTSTSIRELEGRLYQMVGGAEGVVARGSDEYLSKLTLTHATPAEGGVYVCLAVNSQGFSFKKAHLTVLSKPGPPPPPPVGHKERSINWLFLIIPAVVVVVVVVVVIVCQARRSAPDKPLGVSPPTPVLKGDDHSALAPLNQRDERTNHQPTLPRPPDLVYQEVSGYSGGGSVRGTGPGGSYDQYSSPYPESYLDPAYSDPYQNERVPTRSSDHGYARLPHPSLASHASHTSSSPQLPPPYVHPHAHAHTHTHTHRHPQYFVHYNL